MKAKILKHKTIQDCYATLVDLDGLDNFHLAQSSLPDLFPETCTMDGLEKLYKNTGDVFENLKNYDLISVELTLTP